MFLAKFASFVCAVQCLRGEVGLGILKGGESPEQVVGITKELVYATSFEEDDDFKAGEITICYKDSPAFDICSNRPNSVPPVERPVVINPSRGAWGPSVNLTKGASGHPHYIQVLRNNSDTEEKYQLHYGTPFGQQALRVYGYHKGPMRSDGSRGNWGAILVTDHVFAAGDLIDVSVHVSPDCEKKNDKWIDRELGDYEVTLMWWIGEEYQTLANVTGQAKTFDFSHVANLLYVVPRGSQAINQKMAIGLFDSDFKDWTQRPNFDNLQVHVVKNIVQNAC